MAVLPTRNPCPENRLTHCWLSQQLTAKMVKLHATKLVVRRVEKNEITRANKGRDNKIGEKCETQMLKNYELSVLCELKISFITS